MLNKRLKRYELYQETDSIADIDTGSDPSPASPDRQPSAQAILKVVATGTVGATQMIQVVGSTVESILIPSVGKYYSKKTFTSISSISFIQGIDDADLAITQQGVDREPMTQLASLNRYVYGSILRPVREGLDRVPAGELAETGALELIIPKRWRSCGIAKKDWVKDAAGEYYRVVELEDWPDGHIQAMLDQSKPN
jgi:hypothetical protein